MRPKRLCSISFFVSFARYFFAQRFTVFCTALHKTTIRICTNAVKSPPRRVGWVYAHGIFSTKLHKVSPRSCTRFFGTILSILLCFSHSVSRCFARRCTKLLLEYARMLLKALLGGLGGFMRTVFFPRSYTRFPHEVAQGFSVQSCQFCFVFRTAFHGVLHGVAQNYY
jgi:hypothetical protein